jgi:hypothetical protein
MGVFFYTHSVALVEDIPLEETYASEHDLLTDLTAGYEQVTGRYKVKSRAHKVTY